MSSFHERAGELFVSALARPADEREAFLAAACGNDDALRREVMSLLDFHVAEEAGIDDVFAGRPDFHAGDLFADRYRMIARIGRGGMGDVWRADDLTLQTPVALKLMQATTASDRVRLVQEVRLARQITHPAVCRVFDVGEAGDTIFFTMELVEGEDLASLLRRSGRLTSGRVVEIARQLCAGLAAAHAQGVLHRDLKPANILIDANGAARITDFGIAVTTKDAGPHVVIGTLGYMAPEQLATDGHVTERTDVYALGVILRELISEEPDGQLARAIAAATSADPANRPASAEAMAAMLPLPGTATRTLLSRTSMAAAVVASLLVGVTSYWLRPASPVLTDRDTIVVADFLNTTGDPVFDQTLKVALSVALEQSPFLKVFPDDRALQTLALMQHSADRVITRDVAREIAQREQLKALVAGSIAGLGRHYVVALEAVNAATGDVLAREQVEVNSKEEVLSAMGGAVSRLRRKLGESLTSIQRYDVPLPQATTPSLDALQAYARALDQGRVNPRLDAVAHLKRAIELDPHFALAMALLSGIYANTGQTALAPEWSRKAFELRDRVSERERYFISWRYYRDATQAFDRALELARSWTAAYPRESFAFNSLGWASWSLGQREQAIEPLRESHRLDPAFVPPVSNLMAALTALNQLDGAKAVLNESRSAGVDHIAIRRQAYLLALLEGDTAAMNRELSATLTKSDAPLAMNWNPRRLALIGQIAKAHQEFRQGIAAAIQANLPEAAASFGAQESVNHALLGQCLDARREADDALALSRDNATISAAGRALAWCGLEASATKLSAELLERFPDAVLTTRIAVPVMAAAVAIRKGQPAHAVELLETVKTLEHSPAAEFWPVFLRGEAFRQLARPADAAAAFQGIIEHRGEAPDSLFYPLARLGLARALVAGGDVPGGRREYDALLMFWKDADPDLALLQQARAELARLH